MSASYLSQKLSYNVWDVNSELRTPLFDSLYCGKLRKISMSHRDLDLGPRMPNIGPVRVIFIYYNVFKLNSSE